MELFGRLVRIQTWLHQDAPSSFLRNLDSLAFISAAVANFGRKFSCAARVPDAEATLPPRDHLSSPEQGATLRGFAQHREHQAFAQLWAVGTGLAKSAREVG